MMQKEQDIITTSELMDFLDRNSNDKRLKTAIEHLINAVSDWPTNVDEPADLTIILKHEIKDLLMVANIETYQKKLNVNNDAWKMESLSELKNLFFLNAIHLVNKNVELEEILYNITKECRLANKIT